MELVMFIAAVFLIGLAAGMHIAEKLSGVIRHGENEYSTDAQTRAETDGEGTRNWPARISGGNPSDY